MKELGELDNKFRFVILAAKRAKQLLHGSKSRVKSKSKNPIRVAQFEVREGLIDYEIIEPKEEVFVREDEGFIGEEIGGGAGEISKKEGKTAEKKKKKVEDKPKKKVKKKPQVKGTKKKK